MRVICTSKTDLPTDPTTNGEVPPHVALTFAADTFGLDPSSGPLPTASVSLAVPADEAEFFTTSTAYELRFEEAPVTGTADGERDDEPGTPPAGKTPKTR